MANIISLFSGCGGLDLGFEQVGDYTGQSENSVVILLSGYSFVSLRHETMASITDSIS